MNPYTQLTGHGTNVGLSWEMLVSEAAYKLVTAVEGRVATRIGSLDRPIASVSSEHDTVGKASVS